VSEIPLYRRSSVPSHLMSLELRWGDHYEFDHDGQNYRAFRHPRRSDKPDLCAPSRPELDVLLEADRSR
jgi:hypothetical protein